MCKAPLPDLSLKSHIFTGKELTLYLLILHGRVNIFLACKQKFGLGSSSLLTEVKRCLKTT